MLLLFFLAHAPLNCTSTLPFVRHRFLFIVFFFSTAEPCLQQFMSKSERRTSSVEASACCTSNKHRNNNNRRSSSTNWQSWNMNKGLLGKPNTLPVAIFKLVFKKLLMQITGTRLESQYEERMISSCVTLKREVLIGIKEGR